MAGLTIGQSDYLLTTGDIKPAVKKQAGLTTEIPKFGVKDTSGEKSFSDMLSDSIKQVEDLQRHADKSLIDLATGKTKNIHDTMIAVNKAEIAYQLMTQVRNKAVEAYKEIMRMNV